MSDTTSESWADRTVIDEGDLREYVFETGSWEDKKLRVNSYCVTPSIDTLDVDGFIEFLKKQFPRFVFSQTEREKHDWPGIEAIRVADFDDDPRYDGKLGELILFVLVDGLLDLPMVCHKISYKQEPVQEVKGSDGLFFGDFEGHEALAIGEAKIYKRKSQGIDDALESTDRFHGPDAHTKKQHELNVASKTISEDLSEEETKQIIDALAPGTSNHRTIHPVFVGYQEDWLHDVQTECTGPDELKEEIQERIQGSELETTVRNKIQSDYEELEKHWLIFFLIPLEDVDGFREQLQEAIYPHASNH